MNFFITKYIKSALVLTLILNAAPVAAQTDSVKLLPALIGKGVFELKQGTYRIQGTVTINPEARLHINKGVKLLFDPAATIVVYGTLEAIGDEGNFIYMDSYDAAHPGNGIVVKGYNDMSFFMNHVKCYRLAKPLLFESNWYRREVSISNNVFKFNPSDGPAIEFQDVDRIKAKTPVSVHFWGNTFCNNSGGIFISNIATPASIFSFKNNVINRNEFVGKEKNGMFTSPLYFTYNRLGKAESSPIISNNTIFDNFVNFFYDDSMAVFLTNLSVVGSARSIELSGNYFGNPATKTLTRTFDNTPPTLHAPTPGIARVITTPIAEANCNFYEVYINDSLLDEEFDNVKNLFPMKNLVLKFAKAVFPGKDYKLQYIYFQNDSAYIVDVPVPYELGPGSRQISYDFKNFFDGLPRNGYLYLDGAYDNRSFDMPALFIGKKAFAENNKLEFMLDNVLRKKDSIQIIEFNNIKKDIVKKDTVVVRQDSVPTVAPVEKEESLYFRVGVFVGGATYYGDLYKSKLSLSLPTYQLGGGIRFSVDITRRLSINVSANYFRIVGNDNPQTSEGKKRGTGYSRGLSFRTSFVDFNIMPSYAIWRSSDKKFSINLQAGISFLYFKPRAQYQGKWYNLRDIGTAGQTIEGSNNKYKPYAFAIPFGFTVSRQLTKRISAGFTIILNKTTTDYLDDVAGGTKYPDNQELIAANPDLGTIAMQLANPDNQTGLRSYTSPARKDWYVYSGFQLTYQFKRQTKSKH